MFTIQLNNGTGWRDFARGFDTYAEAEAEMLAVAAQFIFTRNAWRVVS